MTSELPGVTDEQWRAFVRGMITAKLEEVSTANALGLFEMMPRRLVDLGLANKLKRMRKDGKTIYVAEMWHPLTSAMFLRSPLLQYRTFVASMQDYSARLDKSIARPDGVSRAGALAVLHRAGPKGLEAWPAKTFARTKMIHDRVAGVF
jgi:hypothetical protein